MEFRLSPAQAKTRLDGGDAVPLDVTSSLVFPVVSHQIRGAIRVPPEPILRGIARRAPADEIMRHFGSLPDGQALIAYCT